jgi:hypothetical protein
MMSSGEEREMTKGENIPCAVCGRGPTRNITIRRHIGLLVVARFIRLRAPLCHEHGVATAKTYLGRTLVQGWWGLFSLVVNPFNVIADIRALIGYMRLPAPPPFPQPAPGTRPRMLRFDGSALPTPF